MSVPESKGELIKAINSNFSSLLRKLENIPQKIAFESVLEGHAKGSVISVVQIVSYLIGWGELVLSWHDKESRGEDILFPESGYKWNELGRLAQKFYLDYEDVKNYEILLTLLKKNNNNILAMIERFSNEELYGKVWYGKWTRGRMIQFNTASPYKNASRRLNKLLVCSNIYNK